MWVIRFSGKTTDGEVVRAEVALELLGMVAQSGRDVNAFINAELAAYNVKLWLPTAIVKVHI